MIILYPVGHQAVPRGYLVIEYYMQGKDRIDRRTLWTCICMTRWN